MSGPVGIVTVHHEGAGSPTNEARGSDDGGYTYWIGTSVWTHLRTVWDSWATINHNGISLDLCLSGNRQDWAVTDRELEVIRGACADARARGYVTPAPRVQPHKAVYATACPGNHTMERWNEVSAAVLAGCGGAPPPPPEVPAMEHGMAADAVLDPERSARGYVLDRWGGIHPFGGAPAVTRGPYWQGLDVARRLIVTDWEDGAGYVLDLDGALHPWGGAPPITDTPYWSTGVLLAIHEL